MMNKTCFVVTFIVALGFMLYTFLGYNKNASTSINCDQIHTFTETEITVIMKAGSKHKDQHVAQDNPLLVKYIRQRFLHRPATGYLKLKNSQKMHNSQVGQSQYIDHMLKQKRNGFYVDCGAHNGEELSNSLFFERFRGWEGILIEVQEASYREMVLKDRKAYTLNVCLSPAPYPQVINFIATKSAVLGALEGTFDRVAYNQAVRNKQAITYKVSCFPLYSILLAVGRTHVDFFTLDVNGAELNVLKTIPFDKVTIDVISLEYSAFMDEIESQKKLKIFRDFFNSSGIYREETILKGLDLVMVRRGVTWS